VSAGNERARELETECASLVQYRDTQKRVDSLVSTLKMVEQKNSNLQESLSSETRFKLDLFSALGDARRQLDAVTSEFEKQFEFIFYF
jgi:chromosome segregation ATPase